MATNIIKKEAVFYVKNSYKSIKRRQATHYKKRQMMQIYISQ